MGKANKHSLDNPLVPLNKEIPLSELLEICNRGNLRLWIKTSCAPWHLPVDMSFLTHREEESYEFRKYHLVWVTITSNHSLQHGIIHAEVTKYNHPEKVPQGVNYEAEERKRKKVQLKIKLINIAKNHNHAKDQNLHDKSVSKIRRNRPIR